MTNKEKEYLDYTECERCLDHKQVEDTLIFKTIDGKWYLRTVYNKDEEIGFYVYCYTEIKYCPYCGRKL